MLPSLLLGSVLLASPALAWSAVGHEIVATIAQAHLTPRTLQAVKEILPQETNGHLASIASWADTIKWNHRDTAGLHFVNALHDDPPSTCNFGGDGWSDDRNLLAAVSNYTTRLVAGEGDIPLRFLVHFIGDLHQPLHLSGKLRGGNSLAVKFEGRQASLHSVWDGLLIQKSIRELGNYTTPLPSKRIESALRGRTYDPYVRFIIAEGIRGFWRSDSLTWPECPSYSLVPPAQPPRTFAPRPRKPPVVKAVLSMFGVPGAVVQWLPEWVLTIGVGKEGSPWIGAFPDEVERKGEVPGCAWAWGKESHPLNCEYVWPSTSIPGMELATPEYLGRVKGDLIVEKQLAKGGIRLASVLNSIFDKDYPSFSLLEE